VFLDLEMTGTDPSADHVCEVALRRVRGGHVQDELVSLVRAPKPVAASREVHGITDDDLAHAPPLHALSPRIAELLDGAVPIGHGLTKDLAFLRAAAVRGEVQTPPTHAIDTLVLARRVLLAPSYRLAPLAERLGLPRPTHRALADVDTTQALFEVLRAALRARTPRHLWQVRVGEKRASMRDDVREALERAAASSGMARVCYRLPRRPPAVDTLRIVRLRPPHVDGHLSNAATMRTLRGDRVLWAEPVEDTGELDPGPSPPPGAGCGGMQPAETIHERMPRAGVQRFWNDAGNGEDGGAS
jgi:DNA polymerase-3 subunit epsilon